MSLIKRMENKETKLKKKINDKIKKIEDIDLKFHNSKISKKEYFSRKKHTEEIIKNMNIRLRMLRGEVVKRKRLADVNNIMKIGKNLVKNH